jgi:hypothetical protein
MSKPPSLVQDDDFSGQTDGLDALRSLGGNDGDVVIYRSDSGTLKYVGTIGRDQLDESVIQDMFGAGRYRVQLRDSNKRIRGSKTIDIDGPLHHATYMPQPRRYASPHVGYSTSPPHDPLAVLTSRVEELARQLSQRPAEPAFGIRDAIELIKAQQPAAQTALGAKDLIELLPRLQQATTPPSKATELVEAFKLFRSMMRGIPAGDDQRETSGLDKIVYVGEKVVDLIASRLMLASNSRPPGHARGAPRPQHVQAAAALPTGAKQGNAISIAPPPRPSEPSAVAAQPQALPVWAEPVAAAVLEVIVSESPADLCGRLVDDLGVEMVANVLANYPEDGQLADVLVAASPDLAKHAVRLIQIEGFLRAIVEADEDDDSSQPDGATEDKGTQPVGGSHNHKDVDDLAARDDCAYAEYASSSVVDAPSSPAVAPPAEAPKAAGTVSRSTHAGNATTESTRPAAKTRNNKRS